MRIEVSRIEARRAFQLCDSFVVSLHLFEHLSQTKMGYWKSAVDRDRLAQARLRIFEALLLEQQRSQIQRRPRRAHCRSFV